MSDVIDDTAVRAEIRAFLHANHVMSLATIVDGAPHACSLMYAAVDFSLYWTSEPRTRHSQVLDVESRVAATIAPDYDDFRAIRGVQIAGRARRLRDAADAELARKLMSRRFAFLHEIDLLPEPLRRAIVRADYYRLDPETITWIDNTRGFGNRHVLRMT